MMYPHLAERIFNVPLAITQPKLEVILSVLGGRLGFDFEGNYDAKVATTLNQNDNIGYTVEHDVAIIPVSGTLVHKTGNIHPASGMTGYDTIRHNFFKALGDPKVKGICLDVDSPGGEVAGCFDLAESIYSARGTKPVMAILTDMAYSAAYAIASAADVITVPQAGGAGSVGVVAAHCDYSKKLSNEGVKVTMIHFGEHKIDGNETMALSDSAFKKLQGDVNKMGNMFVKMIARNRGMSIKAVRDTQASVYLGEDAVAVGFADQVLAPQHAFEALLEGIG